VIFMKLFFYSFLVLIFVSQIALAEEQTVEVIDEEDKLYRLIEILGQWQDKGSVLIFVDKQIEADNLFKELFKVGYHGIVLHGAQD